MCEARGESARDEVIVPAYTCYSVPASIERAGLKSGSCDIDPRHVRHGSRGARAAGTSAASSPWSPRISMAFPMRCRDLERIARERGRVHARRRGAVARRALGGRAVGAFGDAGLYSFDKGKIICTIQGGAMVTHGWRAGRGDRRTGTRPAAELGRRTDRQRDQTTHLRARPASRPLRRHPAAPGARPRPDCVRAALPDRTAQRDSRPAWRGACCPARCAECLDDAKMPRGCTEALQGVERDHPAKDRERRGPGVRAFSDARAGHLCARAFVAALDRAGIGATASYSESLARRAGSRGAPAPSRTAVPGARLLAASIVTLPTHGYCPPDARARAYRAVAPECLG